MTKRRNYTQTLAFYRRVGAGGWSKGNYDTFTSTSPVLRAWIIDHLPRKKRKVLSIGAGRGELEKALIGEGYGVVSVDISFPMLKAAAKAGVRQVVQGNAELLPFRPACFDSVMLCETIGYLQLNKTFQEAYRLLRSRGTLLLTTYPAHLKVHPPYQKHGYPEISTALAAAGFGNIRRELLYVSRRTTAVVEHEEQATLQAFTARKG